jgi:nicotinamide-nucleotide amidase
MKAEIICVGTELLLGDIVNTNAQYLAQQLAELGIAHYYQTVVGDNEGRLHQVIEIACQRAELLIFTGGLGPTPDDLTTESIANFFNTPLIEHPEIIRNIEEKFASRGRIMSPSNRKQALQPEGAEILPNGNGTAPGMIWQPRPNITIMTFPGVPSEMKQMWQDTAIPYLKNQGWCTATIHSRTLKFWGIPESTLAEKVAPFLAQTNPTVAPYAGAGHVKLRISARAASVELAEELIAPVEQELREIAGIDCYGADDDTLPSVVGKLLLERGENLSVAESCTGGILGKMLTDIPGSSRYFMGGIIAYSNLVKINLLDVFPEELDQYGAVSDKVAKKMAQGVCWRLDTTWGLSITGIAGPDGGTEEKPVGLVYIGIANQQGLVKSFCHRLGALRGRDTVRQFSAFNALDMLRREICELSG